MKAIITAAGLGRRSGLNGIMRKELLNIYVSRDGTIQLRPILDELIFRLMRMGIREVAVVLDPGDSISRDYVGRAYPDVKIFFQKERKGFGDAVAAARDFVRDEGFLLAAGDGLLMNIESYRNVLIQAEARKRWTLFIMRVQDPRRYGVAVVKRGEVESVVEKPDTPRSNFAMCALYYLPPRIFNFITYKDGNAELTDAIDSCIRSGIKFRAIKVPKKSWISVGLADDYIRILGITYKYAASSMR